jgi:ABC-type sugar transport systems, ATPase components
VRTTGRPDEILSKPTSLSVSDFISSPSINFAAGRYGHDLFSTGDASLQMVGYMSNA